ncbi:MAG TPA: hypothetical protein VN366_03970 [Feifaniaceae bacterium]|nr:hypothetical protein [Feifaniaceae bacterium]
MQWWKQNGKLLLYMALVLAFGVWGGFTIRDMQVKAAPEPTPLAEQVDSIGEQSILPDTLVITKYMFLLCGGHTEQRQETGGPLVGMNKAQIEEKYPGAKVVELTNKRAVIERELERYCPKHVVLFLDDQNRLAISQTDEADLEKENITTLNYDISYLPAEELNKLDEGLVFENLEEINIYLEGLEP